MMMSKGENSKPTKTQQQTQNTDTETYVTISDRFDFEYTTTLGDFVKGTVDSLEQVKDIRRCPGRTPLGETTYTAYAER